ncbi:MAG: hypothetical protein MHM6MM_002094 [Cercozoa sp. M6MM]
MYHGTFSTRLRASTFQFHDNEEHSSDSNGSTRCVSLSTLSSGSGGSSSDDLEVEAFRQSRCLQIGGLQDRIDDLEKKLECDRKKLESQKQKRRKRRRITVKRAKKQVEPRGDFAHLSRSRDSIGAMALDKLRVFAQMRLLHTHSEDALRLAGIESDSDDFTSIESGDCFLVRNLAVKLRSNHQTPEQARKRVQICLLYLALCSIVLIALSFVPLSTCFDNETNAAIEFLSELEVSFGVFHDVNLDETTQISAAAFVNKLANVHCFIPAINNTSLVACAFCIVLYSFWCNSHRTVERVQCSLLGALNLAILAWPVKFVSQDFVVATDDTKIVFVTSAQMTELLATGPQSRLILAGVVVLKCFTIACAFSLACRLPVDRHFNDRARSILVSTLLLGILFALIQAGPDLWFDCFSRAWPLYVRPLVCAFLVLCMGATTGT